MSNHWYIYREGQQFGPYNRGRLDEMARRGELQPGDQFWAEGMPGWVPGAEVPGLFAGGPSLQAGSPAQPVPPPVEGAPGGRKKMHGCAIAAIVGGGLLVLLVVAIIIGVTAIRGTLRSSDAYRAAMFALQSNPQALELLGEPVEAGRSVSGSVNVSGIGGEAELIIPVSGTLREGSLIAEALKSGGQWTITFLHLETEDGERLDLLASGAAPPKDAAVPAGDMNYFSDEEYGFAMYYPLNWSYSAEGDNALIFRGPPGTEAADIVLAIQVLYSARAGGIYDSVSDVYDDIRIQHESEGGKVLSHMEDLVTFGGRERLHPRITSVTETQFEGRNYVVAGTYLERDDNYYYLILYNIPAELGIGYLNVYDPFNTFELIGLD